MCKLRDFLFPKKTVVSRALGERQWWEQFPYPVPRKRRCRDRFPMATPAYFPWKAGGTPSIDTLDSSLLHLSVVGHFDTPFSEFETKIKKTWTKEVAGGSKKGECAKGNRSAYWNGTPESEVTPEAINIAETSFDCEPHLARLASHFEVAQKDATRIHLMLRLLWWINFTSNSNY